MPGDKIPVMLNCNKKTKMNLNLKRPIVFFDLETTGIDVTKDRIVEISILKINPDQSEESRTHKVNPTIPIKKEASRIHGIKDDDVKDCPTFAEIAPGIVEFIKGCDLAGYNSNKFDIPMLMEELIRADIEYDLKKVNQIDVQVIFFKKEQRTLSAAYEFYCDKELKDAHSAEADTKATYEILKSQLDFYSDLKNDVEELSKFSAHTKNADFAGRIIYNSKGLEVFNFGKHRGTLVVDVLHKEPGYFNWMLNGDFPLYTKKILTAIKLRESFANVKV